MPSSPPRTASDCRLVWANDGLEAVVREVIELDPEWLGVYLELVRRARTDADFKRRIEERQEQVVPVNRARAREAQRTGEFRSDIDARGSSAVREPRAERPRVLRASGDEPRPPSSSFASSTTL